MDTNLNPTFSDDLIDEIIDQMDWNLNQGNLTTMLLTDDDRLDVVDALKVLYYQFVNKRQRALEEIFAE